MRILSFPYGIFQANMYVLAFQNEAILIDPCVDWKQTSIGDMSVKAIICTHGHFDHIQFADDLVNQFRCPLYISQEDCLMLSDPLLNHSGDMGMNISVSTVPCILEDKLYHSSDLGIVNEMFSMQVLRTPGHTAGSICLLFSFEHDSQNVMFTGDMLFAGSVGRTDLGGCEEDMISSISKLKKMNDEIICYPGHGPNTVLGIEKKTNPYFIY